MRSSNLFVSLSADPFCSNLTYVTYYRYNERTGRREVMVVSSMSESSLMSKDKRWFTKTGKPRASIRVKGKRYFKGT